jgi:hypothetical protein
VIETQRRTEGTTAPASVVSNGIESLSSLTVYNQRLLGTRFPIASATVRISCTGDAMKTTLSKITSCVAGCSAWLANSAAWWSAS